MCLFVPSSTRRAENLVRNKEGSSGVRADPKTDIQSLLRTLWVTGQSDEDLSHLVPPLALWSLLYLGAGPCSLFSGQPTEGRQATQSVCAVGCLTIFLLFSKPPSPVLCLGMDLKEVCPSPPEQLAILSAKGTYQA